MTEEAIQAQDEGALQTLEIVSENSLGVFDGQRFYLQRFPVWNMTRRVVSGAKDPAPEEGVVNDVQFWQSMGMMYLQYPVDADATESDFKVDLSSWQIAVEKSGSKIKSLSGDLHKDIRVKLSHWQVAEDGMGGKVLAITLCKKAHKGWTNIWFTDVFNPHNRKQFPWRQGLETKNIPPPEDEKMKPKTSGTQDMMKELLMTQDTSRLVTGITQTEENDYQINLLIWLDEEALEQASMRVPIEDVFAADVEENYLEVYVKGDGYGICWGQLVGSCVPDMTSWELLKSVRREVPKGSGIRCPAYYSPALKVSIVKAGHAQGAWGSLFQDVQHADFMPPRERVSWTERLQRSMLLAPVGFMDMTVKSERAKQIVTKMEAGQDERFVYLNLFLEPRLEVAAELFHVDLDGYFIVNIGTDFIEIKCLADMEYSMVLGKLSGACMPELASWELMSKVTKAGRASVSRPPGGISALMSPVQHIPGSTAEPKAKGMGEEDFMLSITLLKAPGFKGEWEEPLMEPLEPWQLTQLFLDNQLDPAVAASLDEGEGVE